MELQTGFTVRAEPNAWGADGTRVLTAAELRGGMFDFGPSRRVGNSVSLNRYGVEAGEVFFKSRGSGFEAARLPELTEPMVFAAPLVRLRHDSSKLQADYLVWFLNSGPVQTQLETVARGTVIQSVGPTELRQLSIPLPPLQVQQSIAELEGMRRREAALMARLEAARKAVLDSSVFAKLSAGEPQPLKKERA